VSAHRSASRRPCAGAPSPSSRSSLAAVRAAPAPASPARLQQPSPAYGSAPSHGAGGAASPGQLSGFKRPASAISGGAATRDTPPPGARGSASGGAGARAPSPSAAASTALYDRRSTAGLVVTAYSGGAATAAAAAPAATSSPGAGAAAGAGTSAGAAAVVGSGPSYARIPVAELEGRGFRTRAPLSRLNAAPG